MPVAVLFVLVVRDRRAAVRRRRPPGQRDLPVAVLGRQHRRRIRRLGDRRRLHLSRGRSLAVVVDPSHPEAVQDAVVQTAHGEAVVCAFHRDPGGRPVLLVLVVRDDRAGLVPTERHRLVAGPRNQVGRPARRRGIGRRRGHERVRRGASAELVHGPHPEPVGRTVLQPGHAESGRRAAGRDPAPRVLQLVLVVADRPPAVFDGRFPDQRHVTVAAERARQRRRIRLSGGSDGVGSVGGRAPAGLIDRPHSERVAHTVYDEHIVLDVGDHREAGRVASRRDPVLAAALLVLVVRDCSAADRVRGVPAQIDRRVAGLRGEVGWGARLRTRGDMERDRRGGARAVDVHRTHPERVLPTVVQAGDQVAGGGVARRDPFHRPVLLVFVARDRRPAAHVRRRPAQQHLLIAGRDRQVGGRDGWSETIVAHRQHR